MYEDITLIVLIVHNNRAVFRHFFFQIQNSGNGFIRIKIGKKKDSLNEMVNYLAIAICWSDVNWINSIRFWTRIMTLQTNYVEKYTLLSYCRVSPAFQQVNKQFTTFRNEQKKTFFCVRSLNNFSFILMENGQYW